jgi:hypothetical protein
MTRLGFCVQAMVTVTMVTITMVTVTMDPPTEAEMVAVVGAVAMEEEVEAVTD